MDLREKYEELVAERERLKQKHTESKAELNALRNREAELAAEAASLGVADLSKLDETIAALEQEIEAGIASISAEFAQLDNPQLPATLTLEKAQNTLTIDELLSASGQPERRAK